MDNRLMCVVKRKNNKKRKKYPLVYGLEGYKPTTPTQQLELRRRAEYIMTEPPKPPLKIGCSQHHPMFQKYPDNGWEQGVCIMCSKRVAEVNHIDLVGLCYRHPMATIFSVAIGWRVAKFYHQECVSKTPDDGSTGKIFSQQ